MRGPADRDIDSYRGLPGWELVEPGLRDAEAGRATVAANLVWIALPRLVRHGLVSPEVAERADQSAELTLYAILRGQKGDAYGEYNALLRRLCRFERALDRLYTASRKRASISTVAIAELRDSDT